LCGGYSGGDGFAVEQWGQDACGEVRARTDPGRGQFRKGQVRSERRDRRERGYQDSRQRKGPQAQDDRPGRDPNSYLLFFFFFFRRIYSLISKEFCFW
jgi:hypothetical protein